MENINFNLGKYSSDFTGKLNEAESQKISSRIWDKDYTVWKNEPTEISNRLGWLNCSDVAKNKFDEIYKFVDEIKSEGFTHALLLGMGGSSLAPEVFRKIFGVKENFIDLSVLDSTHPDQVGRMLNNFKDKKTLFIVSTKSGGTVETISFMKRFYNTTLAEVGEANVGSRFIAITDPRSGLEQIAKDLRFRKIFINDPNIGGRYSALSLFGIVPAALLGINLEKLFLAVDKTISNSKESSNDILKLGVSLGILAGKGVDKATFILSSNLKPFGAWVEQLIAESTGKEGKGILPVEGEEVLLPEEYSRDRVFIDIATKDNLENSAQIKILSENGFSVISIVVGDIYELGSLFFMWEFATAVASWILNIQPFDQPNVEEAKVIAREMMADYFKTGKLQELIPALSSGEVKVYGEIKSDRIEDSLKLFLQKFDSGKDNYIGRSYVAIHAYIEMNEENISLLHELRTKIEKTYKVATTVGFGPRFLHSTGQLHKGDSGNGLFVQILSEKSIDIPIPNEAGSEESDISFNTLINAQALGDRAALLKNNRRVIRFDISKNISDDLKSLF